MPFDSGTIASATLGSFVGSVFSDTFQILSNEVDMVALNLSVGTAYQFDIDNGTSGDLYIRIFDAFGNEVRANDDGFRNDDDVVFSPSPWFHFMPNFTGIYYVAVSPYYLNGYDPFTTANRNTPENPISTTSGTLTVTAAETDLWSSASGITGLLTEGQFDDTDVLRDEDGSLRVIYTGVINSAGDVDIGRFDMGKGDVIVFDVNGLSANGTVLRIFNSAGTQLGIDDDSGTGDDPELAFVLPTALSVFVGISGDGNNLYSAVTGASTLAGALGDFEVIIHKNPTQIGSSVSNSFIGSSAANYIVTLAGNDTAFGNDGDDTLAGGDDQDSLSGGNGQDVVYGEHGNDTLRGNGGSDVLIGGLGTDNLDGGGGRDHMVGDSGDDTLSGGSGGSADTLSGGIGNDSLAGGNGGDSLLGDLGDDILIGGGQDDVLAGGDGNDILSGGTDNDLLFGDAGNDSLSGSGGLDTMVGGVGDDTLTAGAENDRLQGGLGNDSLTGGANDDAFVFTSVGDGVDTITDFALASGDVIDLSLLFGAGVVTAGTLSQFVQSSTSGVSDSFLAVDADGLAGGLSFTIIAQVNGVTAAQLFDVTNFTL